ncbi:MAG TPA: MFS transporter [Solirubrobacteraceae bacterium]|jgi:EmrB/QacA subfamily drug resistance transporter
MRTRWSTLLAVCVGTFMLLLDVSVVMVALPSIQGSLGATFSEVQWVVDAYALTLAATLLTAGSLADRYGHRRFYLLGLALFAGASLLCGLAQSPLMLILTRGLQGIGGAIMFSTALGLLGHHYRGADRKIAFAVWGATTGLALALGPLAGGLLIDALDWRWIFLVNVPIAFLASALTRTGVSETREVPAGGLDWLGFVTFSGALGGLVYGLIRGTPDGWTSGGVLTGLIAAPILLGAFALAELRAESPMFELRLLRKPAFAGASVAAFVTNATLPALVLYLVVYLQQVLGYDALQTGVRLLVLSGGIAVGGIASGRLSEHVPPRAPLAAGLTLAGVGLLLMRGLTATSGWNDLVPGLLVSGFGMGLVNPALASLAVDVVGAGHSGMGAGINTTFRQVGIATGIAGLGSVFIDRVGAATDAGLSRLGSVPADMATRVADGLSSGRAAETLGSLPPSIRAQAQEVARGAVATGLNDIFLIAAVVAFAGALASLLLVRSRDVAPARDTAGPARPDVGTGLRRRSTAGVPAAGSR